VTFWIETCGSWYLPWIIFYYLYFIVFYWVCLLIAIASRPILCLAPCVDRQCAWHMANNTRLLKRLAFTFPSCRKCSTLYLSVHWASIPARGLLCLKMPRLYLSVLLIRPKPEIVVIWFAMPDTVRTGVPVLRSAVHYSVILWCHSIPLGGCSLSFEGLSTEFLVRDGKYQNFPFQQGLYKYFVKYVLTGNIRLHH
jgi:hypothetical protein